MPSSHSRSDGKTVSVCLVYPDLRRAIHAEPPRRAAAVGPDCRAGGALLGMSTLRVQGLSIQAIGRLRNAQNLADGMPLFRSVSRSLPPHAPNELPRRIPQPLSSSGTGACGISLGTSPSASSRRNAETSCRSCLTSCWRTTSPIIRSFCVTALLSSLGRPTWPSFCMA